MFQNLQILELAGVLAGPSVGTFFAELGARVIKIENPKTGGDVTRSWRTEHDTGEISSYYASVNHSKEVRFLDLSQLVDREEFNKLLLQSDILLVNFKEGDAQKFKLSFEDCCAIKPDLIYANLRGFAFDAARPAFDVVLQAECGFMAMNGEAEGLPTKMPLALIDVLAGHQLKEAILIALLQKMSSGKGAEINCSLEESALSALINQASHYLMTGEVNKRSGSLHPNIAPYGEMLQSADGALFVLAVGNNKHFEALCRCLNVPELIAHPKYLNSQPLTTIQHINNQ